MAANQDIFARTELNFGGAFTVDGGMVVADGQNGLTGVLLTNLQISHQQNINKIFDLGVFNQKANMYYIGGRAQGSLNAGHIVGPALALKDYYTRFSDVCKARTNTIELKLNRANCDVQGNNNIVQNVGGISLTCKYCVLQGVQFGVNSQDTMINESSAIQFGSLSYEENRNGFVGLGALANAAGGAVFAGANVGNPLLPPVAPPNQ